MRNICRGSGQSERSERSINGKDWPRVRSKTEMVENETRDKSKNSVFMLYSCTYFSFLLELYVNP